MKTALVLSGGSIKGAFQAGAIKEVLEAGIEPSAIYGISVGSLNGGFLADRAGKAGGNIPAQINWPEIGRGLGDFWLEKVTSFSRIGKKRGKLTLLWQLITSKFNGLIDTKKLRQLVYETMNGDDLRESPIIFKSGSVNIADGTLILADKSSSNFIEYIIASTAIPVVMPVSLISGQPLVDGGVRDVAALSPAIDDGAEEIICILCQPRNLSGTSVHIGKLEEFAERIMDIIINETVNNDIEWAQYINKFCPRDGTPVSGGPLDGYRYIPLTVIRPVGPLDITLTDFSRDDIRRIYEDGREAARQALSTRSVGVPATP